jgi:hypothetical protein
MPNIEIARTAGGNVPTYRWQTDAGDAAIKAGDPVKLKAAGSPYVIGLVDGDHTIGTDTSIVGVAASASTHTASVDGFVDVYVPLPGIVYSMKATTPANVDTAAEILALCGDRKSMDLTGTTYTMDEDSADAAANAFVIVGGDHVKKTLEFIIRANATILGDSTIA